MPRLRLRDGGRMGGAPLIVLALGVPRMGKTQALMDYVGAHATQNRFLVVDRAGDWAWPNNPRWRGASFIRWKKSPIHEHLAFMADANERQARPWFGDAPAKGLDEWLASLPSSGIFRFGWPFEGEDVARMATDIGNCVYVDDEVDLVALQAGWTTNPLRDVAHRGRHLPNAKGQVGEVHFLGACRRLQSLATDVTSLADTVFVFRSQGHRTFQRLLDDRIIEDDEVDRIRTLEPYHYKLWESSGSSSWGRLSPL